MNLGTAFANNNFAVVLGKMFNGGQMYGCFAENKVSLRLVNSRHMAFEDLSKGPEVPSNLFIASSTLPEKRLEPGYR
jgi:hypothetical protein